MDSSIDVVRRISVGVVAVLVVGLGLTESRSAAQAASPSLREDLGFEQRVAAQRAIEEVYWRHGSSRRRIRRRSRRSPK